MPKIDFDEEDWYGLLPPKEMSVIAAWGSECTFGHASGRRDYQWIDAMHDRKQLWVHEGANIDAFMIWLQLGCRKWLQSRCGHSHIDPGSPEFFILEKPPFYAMASPLRSYKYLYVGAWMVEPTAAPPRPRKARKPA
jgi:hypothetical protein